MFYLKINLRETRLKFFRSAAARRALQRIYKEEGQKVGEHWLRSFAPLHFMTQGFGRYHMAARTAYYNKVKRERRVVAEGWVKTHDANYRTSRLIRKPQVVPLVMTGQAQDRVRALTAKNVKATAPWWGGRGNAGTEAEVKIVIPIPIGHPLHPKQASTNGPGTGEMVRTIASERKILGELFCLAVWRRLTTQDGAMGRDVA
ncbi:MAG: hypothetical protein EB060_08675 [Proteobacteria bacterium]|nr:hypothetical protein [Pseudomonadota bacterium]